MKKLVLVVAAMMTFLAGNAQSSKEAKQLLNEVSSKVEAYDNIVIEFKYGLENTAENVKHETRGDVSLEGEKYLLNIMGTTRLFDGSKLYTIIPEDEEINISSHNPEDDQDISPSKMLTFYNDGYKTEMGPVQDLKGRKIQYVKLTPIDSNAEIREIHLGIDKQTKHIYNMIQTQDNGTKITITVNSFKTNQPLPQSLFQFKESRYKDYYINRLD
ncbi:outer membrane lipoprotein carrier protein LolA [Salinimicrobium tongyeongense]|jgi:outer membrane lipoprotein-sorting protein|uniref:Outer membrane lipoprotein carrier protein LolA n=1 Tax=Salinimicrobium tongyeongense TaxID=2809707 RepID=A0ABY6NRC7_9FLAO|nr:outer membrane lipoprotein carrier protein LolA [Salinimicrobium tongyeongense]UZH55459.1 outer membrane lipoprotein carrier protein LolA [Salinimicrobium tongyeongense]